MDKNKWYCKSDWLEFWCPIEGYEGLYEVSNLGRVKSLGNDRARKERILKAGKNNGYSVVALRKDGKSKTYFVHRLVAEAFIPNPNNYPVINHKDEVKNNNYVHINPDKTINEGFSNLEWCTQKYNVNYSKAKKRKIFLTYVKR